MGKCIFYITLASLILSCSKFAKRRSEVEQAIASNETLKLDLDVKKFTLDNGLRILVIENDKLPIFSYYTFYDVGGRYEEKGTTGATHFLEHMMFKGSKNYGPNVFDDTIENSGGSTNAYTTFDSTVYYESLPSESLEKIIQMESDRMQNLLLDPQSVEKERNVVFEERKMRYENSPRGKLYLKLMQNTFKGTPYGGSVIGEVSDLKALTRDNLFDFYKRFYTPDNAIIVVSGDVDADEVYSLIKENMGSMQASKDLVEYKEQKDAPANFVPKVKYPQEYKINGSNPVGMIGISFPGVKLGERKGFVLDILSSILGDGESSYWSQKFVKSRKPIMSGISVMNYTLKHNGAFMIMAQLAGKNTPNVAKNALLRDVKQVCKKAIDERSVQKTKNQYLLSYFSQIQSNAGVASFVGTREYYFNDYSFYKRELDIYKSITAEEVKKECEALFKDNNYVYVGVWNKYKG